MDSISYEDMLGIERIIISNPHLYDREPLDTAAQLVIRSMWRPKGKRADYYQRQFDSAVETAHTQNPLVSRALLARMAVQRIADGTYAAEIEDIERQRAQNILDREFIAL